MLACYKANALGRLVNDRLMLDTLIDILDVASPILASDVAVRAGDHQRQFAAAVSVIGHCAARCNAQKP